MSKDKTGKAKKNRAPATSNSSQERLNALQKTGDSRVKNGLTCPGQAARLDGYRVDNGERESTDVSGTSIFDPVLCELAYRWFTAKGDSILDPFAGGSVRGIVAGMLGRHYTGIDLSARQIDANRAQLRDIKCEPIPAWIVGDSREQVKALPDKARFDLVFSCPPYYDLEVYSEDGRDLSTLDTYDKFMAAYRAIIADCVARLNDDRFACMVVGDIRDKRGCYRNFPADTTAAFMAAGMTLYNEAVLVTAVGSLPLRAGRAFSANRKLGKTHQNVLVYVKGDPHKAAKHCGEVDVALPEGMA
ncbi:MAG: DNA methyltransferase [Gemmatimonadaceae bacterium]|jgi:DNA modification methylase